MRTSRGHREMDSRSLQRLAADEQKGRYVGWHIRV